MSYITASHLVVTIKIKCVIPFDPEDSLLEREKHQREKIRAKVAEQKMAGVK